MTAQRKPPEVNWAELQAKWAAGAEADADIITVLPFTERRL